MWVQASFAREQAGPEDAEVLGVSVNSPVLKALAVPEWLSSPRSSSVASWQSGEQGRSGSRSVTEASESPRRRSARSLGNANSAYVSSEPSSENATDMRQDRKSFPRSSEDSQGHHEAGHAIEGSSGSAKTEVNCTQRNCQQMRSHCIL